MTGIFTNVDSNFYQNRPKQKKKITGVAGKVLVKCSKRGYPSGVLGGFSGHKWGFRTFDFRKENRCWQRCFSGGKVLVWDHRVPRWPSKQPEKNGIAARLNRSLSLRKQFVVLKGKGSTTLLNVSPWKGSMSYAHHTSDNMTHHIILENYQTHQHCSWGLKGTLYKFLSLFVKVKMSKLLKFCHIL